MQKQTSKQCNQQNSVITNDLSHSNSNVYQQELMNHQFNQFPPPYMVDQSTNRSIFQQEQTSQRQTNKGQNVNNMNQQMEQKQIELQKQNSNNTQKFKKGNTIKQGQTFNNKYDLNDIELGSGRFQDKQYSFRNDSETNLSYKKKLSRYKTNIKQNTFSYKVITAANQNILWYSQKTGYHEQKCCFDLIYTDDCCIKQLTDLVFHILFIPFKILSFIADFISRKCCSKMDCCVKVIKQIQDVAYSPFACFGTWINQCWYSIKLFCCQEIKYLPNNSSYFIQGCCIQNCIQAGQCIKNCCSFSVDFKCCKACDCSCLCVDKEGECCCQNFCLKIGDCFQNLLIPQGFCEYLFELIEIITCKRITLQCCEVLFCCCFKIKSITVENKFIGKTNECCCCIIKTDGNIEV